jgi:outer membrane cobalamin receptor
MPLSRKAWVVLAFHVVALAQSNPQQPPPDQATVRTAITVNDTVSAETPAALTVVNQDQIKETPGVNLDDRLRQVPGFSLFRRSSSIVANPTTQGVSLRGIGSTGASRTLVLWDGIPINDPFGGWIYWTRIDPSYIDRVEVDRGATTSVFGDRSLAGTISLFSPQEKPSHIYGTYFAGNEVTQQVSAGYSNLWGRWAASIQSRAFTTDGYFITPEPYRGTADDRANVRFVTGSTHVDYLGDADHFSLHFDILAEERQNGTFLTHNSTGLGTLGATYTHSWANDQVSFLAYHTREQFHSTYSSVAADRDSERLTSRQTVPAEDIGGAAFWKHHAHSWNTIFGADVDDTHGTSFDYSYTTLRVTPSGGTLLKHGVFAQGDIQFGPARFFGGIRHQITGLGTDFVSPNGGVAVGVGQFRFRGSAYRSLRAPTLNELYRQFRVGNVLTLANPALVPEETLGTEAGVDWSSEGTTISLGLFRNDLTNLIANATLNTTPSQITRQRSNFASGLSRGIEASIRHRWAHWTAEGAYLFADSRLSTGQRFAQVPKQQGTAQLTYSAKGTIISGGVRAFGLQFDDDLNQFRLPGYAALQLTAQQRITSYLTAIADVENLLDRSYLVAQTPNPNTGAPRLWRVGLRWSAHR